MDSDVTQAAEVRNGFRSDGFAAVAASVRSKLDEAARLLDEGDVDGARAVIGAALLELEDGAA